MSDPTPAVRRCRPVHAPLVAAAAFPDLRLGDGRELMYVGSEPAWSSDILGPLEAVATAARSPWVEASSVRS